MHLNESGEQSETHVQILQNVLNSMSVHILFLFLRLLEALHIMMAVPQHVCSNSATQGPSCLICSALTADGSGDGN